MFHLEHWHGEVRDTVIARNVEEDIRDWASPRGFALNVPRATLTSADVRYNVPRGTFSVKSVIGGQDGRVGDGTGNLRRPRVSRRRLSPGPSGIGVEHSTTGLSARRLSCEPGRDRSPPTPYLPAHFRIAGVTRSF